MKTNSDSPRLLRDRDPHIRCWEGKHPQLTPEIHPLEERFASSFSRRCMVWDVALSRNKKPYLNEMCLSSWRKSESNSPNVCRMKQTFSYLLLFHHSKASGTAQAMEQCYLLSAFRLSIAVQCSSTKIIYLQWNQNAYEHRVRGLFLASTRPNPVRLHLLLEISRTNLHDTKSFHY